jgi:AcrR family transcriptional regulator
MAASIKDGMMDGKPGKPASARNRSRRKEARPSEIVDAARAEFIDKGFSAARIDDVALRAGVSKGLVYVYFPSKEALFEAVIQSAVAPVIGNVGAMLAADMTTPAPDQLRMILSTLYRELVLTERRRLLHLIIAEGPRFPEIAGFYHREVISPARAILRTLIERGIARGEFSASAPIDYPEIVVAPALLAAIWKLLLEPHEPIDAERYMAAHLDLVLRGLAA